MLLLNVFCVMVEVLNSCVVLCRVVGRCLILDLYVLLVNWLGRGSLFLMLYRLLVMMVEILRYGFMFFFGIWFLICSFEFDLIICSVQVWLLMFQVIFVGVKLFLVKCLYELMLGVQRRVNLCSVVRMFVIQCFMMGLNLCLLFLVIIGVLFVLCRERWMWQLLFLCLLNLVMKVSV